MRRNRLLRRRIPPKAFVAKPNAITAGFVMAFLFCGVGVVVLATAIHTALKAEASRRWQQVDGFVNSDKERTIARSLRTYREIKYRYEFGGKRFSSDRICFGINSHGGRYVRPYSAGSRLTVFVNPANAAESVLAPGVYVGGSVFCASGLVLLLFGLVFFFASN